MYDAQHGVLKCCRRALRWKWLVSSTSRRGCFRWSAINCFPSPIRSALFLWSVLYGKTKDLVLFCKDVMQRGACRYIFFHTVWGTMGYRHLVIEQDDSYAKDESGSHVKDGEAEIGSCILRRRYYFTVHQDTRGSQSSTCGTKCSLHQRARTGHSILSFWYWMGNGGGAD